MSTYRVKSGDTLFTLSRKFNVPVDAIVDLNQIKDPNQIGAGIELEMPENTTDAMDAVMIPVETPPTVSESIDEPGINRSRFQLPPKEYKPTVCNKDLIVLHFTAGRTAKSAFDTWIGNTDQVATAYLVGTNGSVYQLFDPSHWAYHLGIRSSNGKHDKRSIGIEIVNVGPLKLAENSGTVLNWWPKNWRTRWCHLNDNGKYFESAYRGIDFFATYPEEQLGAVVELVYYLCERFEIPKAIPPSDRLQECDDTYFDNFRGVASHQNFREDKWDVGPAFDWQRLGF